MKFLIWITLINFLIIIKAEEERPLVSLNNGLVRGVHRTSYDGRKYSAFEGIPYARPPIGNLRFKDPQPPLSWTGVLEATSTYRCVQYSMFNPNVVGQEDCLYLNVYVPRQKINATEGLDVIVHFHGGAYMMGAPNEVAGPSKLMDRDLVYVNLYYRLGPLGFLSFGDSVIPGNYGMKDQTFALKWVKENIKKFGGNPASVTINGGSAGGASTHLHYFSPISKGLFHRGIAGNGVGLTPWAIRPSPHTPSKRLAQDLGCFNESTTLILRCMQERSALQIQETMKKQYINFETLLPLAPFGPVIEPSSATAFLSTDPYVQYKEKKVTDVPFMSIMTTAEGTVLAYFYMQKLDVLNENLRSYLPVMFDYDTYTEDIQKKITEKVIQHYFNNEPITMANFNQLVKLGTDRLFHVGAEKSVKLHASSLKSDAFLLLVGYGGDTTFPGMEGLGVGHCQDMNFYYDINMPGIPSVNHSAQELIMKEKFLDMFANFAKTGIPTIEGVDFEPVPKDGTLKYLTVNGPNNLEMTTSNSLGDREFWDSLGL